jgi:hypothetical protein
MEHRQVVENLLVLQLRERARLPERAPSELEVGAAAGKGGKKRQEYGLNDSTHSPTPSRDGSIEYGKSD